MDDQKRRLAMQAAAWGLTVAAALLVWWATSDDGDGSTDPVGRTSFETTVPTPGDETSTPPTSATTDEPTSAASTDPLSGLPWVSADALPVEARDTLDEIADGPPYPYDRDGVTFENREGLLPDEEIGYYQEFTVETPGSADRGARRIVWGLEDEFYYTDDHYASFRRIGP